MLKPTGHPSVGFTLQTYDAPTWLLFLPLPTYSNWTVKTSPTPWTKGILILFSPHPHSCSFILSSCLYLKYNIIHLSPSVPSTNILVPNGILSPLDHYTLLPSKSSMPHILSWFCPPKLFSRAMFLKHRNTMTAWQSFSVNSLLSSRSRCKYKY